MDKILIRGLEVEARHGVHEFEKQRAQRFIFDADIFYECRAAAKSDNVENTISYSDVCNLISDIALNNTFNLIETLAYKCAYAVMDKFPAKSVAVTVYKPDAPVKHKFSTVGFSTEVKRETAYLSIGSNMGDRRKFLDTSIEKLSKTAGITVKKVSSYIETAPYGGAAHGDFLNCAAEISTYLPPRALLDEIHRIESECGRVRDVRWGDRTLDIDIIFYGNLVVRGKDLTIPHPDYMNRDFVLQPLSEIAPDFICPLTGKSVKRLKLGN